MSNFKNFHEDLYPIFCSVCGARIGWQDTAYSEPGIFVCDDCGEDYKKGVELTYDLDDVEGVIEDFSDEEEALTGFFIGYPDENDGSLIISLFFGDDTVDLYVLNNGSVNYMVTNGNYQSAIDKVVEYILEVL